MSLDWKFETTEELLRALKKYKCLERRSKARSVHEYFEMCYAPKWRREVEEELRRRGY